MTKIVVLHFSNPASYPPLMNAIRCFEAEDWVIDVFSAPKGGSGGLNPPEVLKASFHNFHAPKFLSPKFVAIVLFFKVCFFLRNHRIDYLYVSDPHSCVVGGVIEKIFNVKIIYHEHDSPVINKNNILKKMRAYIIKKAAAIVVPNNKRLEKGIKAPVFEVMNVPSIKDLQHIKSSIRDHDNNLKVYYHGSINKNRLPLILLTAIKQIRQKVELLVVGYETIGSWGYKKYLSELAIRNNVQLEFQGPYSHKKCLDIATSQSVGICFYQGSDDINFKYMWGASNKIYDYLSSGLALLIEDRKEFREGFEGLNLPVVFVNSSNENSIIEGLEKISKLPDECYQNIPKIMKNLWNYEYQFAPVIQFIKGLERC